MSKEIKLTEKDTDILNYLKSKTNYVGPTEIGLHFGQPYNTASSWCSSSLKRLIKAKMVTTVSGKYHALTNL